MTARKISNTEIVKANSLGFAQKDSPDNPSLSTRQQALSSPLKRKNELSCSLAPQKNAALTLVTKAKQ
jgi:hypothetical protein